MSNEEIKDENLQGETIDIDFNVDEGGLQDERPQYGGEDGRPYDSRTQVGYDEYVDGSSGVERVYHNNTEEQNYTTNITRGVGLLTDAMFEDYDGNPMATRNTEGAIWLSMVPVDAITYLGEPKDQVRKDTTTVYGLANMIDHIGMLTPIHVIPFGEPIGYEQDENGYDIESLPIYAKYILFQGARRYESVVNLGKESVLALIDTTIPHPLIPIYQAFAQYNEPYTFSEKMNYNRNVRLKQPKLSSDLIESALGYHTGELAKAEYIDSMKVDFPDIYNKVESGKFTIEQGFKAIEKEQAKAEKEREKEDKEDDESSSSSGSSSESLDELDIEANQQELGDRKILDAPTRRAVEARDGAKCQGCGYGDQIPDLASMFSVHHMVPVQYGGSDAPNNLILLCQNCHKMVHDYEIGRIALSKETFNKYDDIKRVVVLGNVLRKARVKAIKTIREEDPALARRMDKGVISVGRALQKGNIKIHAESDYPNDSPYQAFMDTTSKLKYGGRLEGDLAEFDDEEVDEEGVDEGDLTLEDLILDVEIEEELQDKGITEDIVKSITLEETEG